MLRYVARPEVWQRPRTGAAEQERTRKARARLIRPGPGVGSTSNRPCWTAVTTRHGGDTIYLSAIDRDGNIVSLIQSIYQGFGSGLVPAGTGFALHNRGALFTLDEAAPERAGAAQTSAAHDHPGVHAEGRAAHRLRHHGRLESGAGPRAVRREHRRLRHGHSAGARGGAVHEEHVRRSGREHRGAVPRPGAGGADAAGPRGDRRAAAKRRLWIGSSSDERRRHGRAFRRLGAAPRRRRHPGSAAGVFSFVRGNP